MFHRYNDRDVLLAAVGAGAPAPTHGTSSTPAAHPTGEAGE